MANKKKEYYKPGPMTEGKRNIIQGLLQEYNIESAADIQEALKDLLGGTIKEIHAAQLFTIRKTILLKALNRSWNVQFLNALDSKSILPDILNLIWNIEFCRRFAQWNIDGLAIFGHKNIVFDLERKRIGETDEPVKKSL